MKALYIHAKEFFYRPVEKVNISIVEGIEPKSYTFQDCLVVFVTIEKGDFSRRQEILREFVSDVSGHIERLKVACIVVYPYAHLSDVLEEPRLALRMLKFIDKEFKSKFREVSYHRAPFGWYKEFRLHCLGHPLSELSRKF